MTREELQALIEILNRAPVSQAERMWVQALVLRESQRIVEAEAKQQPAAR